MREHLLTTRCTYLPLSKPFDVSLDAYFRVVVASRSLGTATCPLPLLPPNSLLHRMARQQDKTPTLFCCFSNLCHNKHRAASSSSSRFCSSADHCLCKEQVSWSTLFFLSQRFLVLKCRLQPIVSKNRENNAAFDRVSACKCSGIGT